MLPATGLQSDERASAYTPGCLFSASLFNQKGFDSILSMLIYIYIYIYRNLDRELIDETKVAVQRDGR